MIAAVMVIRNEADICGLSLRHSFAEGIDRIYVADAMSNDGTRDIYDEIIAEGHDLRIQDDTSEFLYQDELTNSLVRQAGSDGADWVLPIDADEFVYASDGRTVAEALADCPYDKLFVRMWQQWDIETKSVAPKPLPKVAFKYAPEARVNFGNHDVSLPGGAWDVLELREVQYRSAEHFLTKIKARNTTVSPIARQTGHGSHHVRLDGMSDEQLLHEWAILRNVPTVVDPIPSHA